MIYGADMLSDVVPDLNDLMKKPSKPDLGVL